MPICDKRETMRLFAAIFMLIFSPGLLMGQSIFRSMNIVMGNPASATVISSCPTHPTAGTPTLSCTLPVTTAGQSIIFNFTFADNQSIVLSASCQSATPTLVAVSPAYPTFWNGNYYDYTYEFTNVNTSTNCVVSTTVSTTPGGDSWGTAVLVGGCASVCAVDVASSTPTTGTNTITGASVTTTVPNELMLSFCAVKSLTDTVSINSTPQTMTLLQQVAPGALAGSSIAATAGSHFTQCTGSFLDNANLDIVAVK